MKTLRIWFLACAIWSLEAQEWEQSLTDFQQFRIYPHVDMAARMQQKHNYSAAAAELNRALSIVPDHPPLLLMLLDIQLAIPDIAAAINTLDRLPADKRPAAVEHLLQSSLAHDAAPAQHIFLSLLPRLQPAEQQRGVFLLSQRLIGQQQYLSAYQLLMQYQVISPELLLQRATLAEQLGEKAQALADLQQLQHTDTSDGLAAHYCMSLLQSGQLSQAKLLADTAPESDWAAGCYRQLLQTQLAAGKWEEAEQSFKWLAQHQHLNQQELQQRYQVAINSGQQALARELVSGIESSCMQQVVMLEQSGAVAQAKAHFSGCQAKDDAELWLSYAERWLTATQLNAASIPARWQAQKDNLVHQKQITEGDYDTLARSLFSKPLHRQDYQLLLTVADRAKTSEQRLRYYEALYNAMPDTYLLDRLTDLYVENEQPQQALSVMLAALPFSAEQQQHPMLPARLINLLQQQPPQSLLQILPQLNEWNIQRSGRAELWRLAGDCQQAAALLSPQPDSPEGWQTLAMCENKAQPALAVQHWQQLYNVKPESRYLREMAYLYQRLNRPEQALQQLQKIPEAQLTETDQLEIAMLARQTGNLPLALSVLEQLTPATPELQAGKWAELATLYQQLNQPEQAEHAWQQALTLAPEYPEYLAGYGYFLSDKQPEKALQLLLKAHDSSQYQQNPQISAQLAYLYQRTGDVSQTHYWAGHALEGLQALDGTGVRDDDTLLVLQRLYHQALSHWQFSASTVLSTGNHLTNEQGGVQNRQANIQTKYSQTIKAEYFTNPLLRDFMLFGLLTTSGESDITEIQGTQLGVSYKPLNHYNVWLTAAMEKVPLSDGDWQSQLRITGDFLNRPPWQEDWRPKESRWWERKLYADLVLWPESGNRLAQLRYAQGPVWKLGRYPANTIKGYGLFQFDYQRFKNNQYGNDTEQQWSTGLGVQWRTWGGLALQRKLEINLEWQYQLHGDLNDQHTLQLLVYTVW